MTSACSSGCPTTCTDGTACTSCASDAIANGAGGCDGKCAWQYLQSENTPHMYRSASKWQASMLQYDVGVFW